MHSCGARWGEAVIKVARETEAQISEASTNVLRQQFMSFPMPDYQGGTTGFDALQLVIDASVGFMQINQKLILLH